MNQNSDYNNNDSDTDNIEIIQSEDYENNNTVIPKKNNMIRRMIGAALLNVNVYEEIEADPKATFQAVLRRREDVHWQQMLLPGPARVATRADRDKPAESGSVDPPLDSSSERVLGPSTGHSGR